MTRPHVEDPLESADNPQVGTPEYYGQLDLDGWYCYLEKGKGKVPFDAVQHPLDQRRTAIRMSVQPIAEQKVTREIFREFVAEFGPWPRITLPSIKALGKSVRDLDGSWAKVALVPEGRSYVTASGETRESTTFELRALFDSEAECRTAYLASFSEEPDAVSDSEVPAPTPAPMRGDENGTDQAARETALRFAAAIVKQEAGDRVRVAEKIAKMAPVSRYFTIDSPEIAALCAAEQVAALSH